MDKVSINKLGLSSYANIDDEACDESYDSSTNNHIIFIKLKKADKVICPKCGIVNHYTIRGSKKMKIDHASGLENNIVLVLSRRVYRCSDCSYIF